MRPLFIATEKFDPSDGVKWHNYIQWANLPQLTEVVSLDGILCPCAVRDLTDEDWKHNVHEDYRLKYFYNLDYLLRRVAGVPRANILGLYRNPESHVATPPGAGWFSFLGHDLIEEATQISALTNCGGFPDTFSNDELNSFGLFTDFLRASEVHQQLIIHNPQEHHARCELYAIWRLTEADQITSNAPRE